MPRVTFAMTTLLASLGVILLGLGLLVLWMAGGVQSERSYVSEPVTIRGVTIAPVPPRPTELKLLVYNIAWGYGFGSEGTGKAKPREHFERSIGEIGNLVKKLDADIVLFQEIDFDSTRSGRIDQLAAIAARAGLPYAAYAPSWMANWIPFPYWPPREHYGRMRSGGAILSRYPITKSIVHLLEKPPEQPFWYRMFYLFRFLQQAEIEVGGRTITVFNTHLEAFSLENRLTQVRVARQILDASMHPRVLLGGDLNAVPPEATQKHDYPDEKGAKTQTSHDGDDTVGLFRELTGLRDSVPPERYRASEAAWLTFPAHAPNRMLDHLFYGSGFEVLEARVVKEAGEVSDHLPLFVRVGLGGDAG